jgi:adenosylhomocysteine nucleosidase
VPAKIAIVAALEREIHPLVKSWPSREQQHSGRTFRFYENGGTVVTCGGIGPEPARRATEAILSLYHPTMIYSAGFAGALDATLKVGDILLPRRVVNAADGSSLDTGQGEGVLISFSSVAGPEQKKMLANSYAAQAVDMEAAAVGRAAELRGIPFAVVKAISDENDFTLPPMERFIQADGKFNAAGFARFAILRPWTWGATLRLAGNSRRASAALCDWIERMDNNTRAALAVESSRRS